ncbi:MAG: hypothetical protein OXH23_16320, partial [bacterium]|nr:hypothetical protein [bacterium]
MAASGSKLNDPLSVRVSTKPSPLVSVVPVRLGFKAIATGGWFEPCAWVGAAQISTLATSASSASMDITRRRAVALPPP